MSNLMKKNTPFLSLSIFFSLEPAKIHPIISAYMKIEQDIRIYQSYEFYEDYQYQEFIAS